MLAIQDATKTKSFPLTLVVMWRFSQLKASASLSLPLCLPTYMGVSNKCFDKCMAVLSNFSHGQLMQNQIV